MEFGDHEDEVTLEKIESFEQLVRQTSGNRCVVELLG
jgi:hypothetical protein